MYEIIQDAHAVWAYVVLLLLIVAVLIGLTGYATKRTFTAKDRLLMLLALIATHIQLLIGLVLYVISPLGLSSLGEMKNADIRLTSLEHPLVNLIALTLITIGWSRHKKLVDSTAKFKTFAVFYGIGLLLILSRIPWDLWFQKL
ncbi:MAG TPA: hypothetical protein VFQ50_02215 [Flavobacterium sp.]|jgi:hypothetical protein|nr:hypothetical protein [Flavobacterium sp.]